MAGRFGPITLLALRQAANRSGLPANRMLALLTAYPRVYVDVALINTVLPRPEFHAYLRCLVDAASDATSCTGPT